MPHLDTVLRERKEAREKAGTWRSVQATEPGHGAKIIRHGKTLISFSSNDYLGLSQHPDVRQAASNAANRYPTGAGASRLVTGDYPLLHALEAKLAQMKGTDAACVFGSGYLANIGTISAVMGKGDLILADRLAHACLLDGARLSGAKLLRFPHNDTGHAERLLSAHRAAHRNCLLVVDGVYSMDGDRAPLPALSALAKAYDAWLMVDDAHGFGVLGQGSGIGKGTAAEWDPVPAIDIQMGTLSKAVGGYGGYVCGSHALVETLRNAARSYMFSTALPPVIAASALAALHIIENDADLVQTPLRLSRLFTETAGLSHAESAIVPLILGTPERAMAASALLENHGFLVTAIRPPTVPEHTSRLRFAFNAHHAPEDIVRVAEIVKEQGWV